MEEQCPEEILDRSRVEVTLEDIEKTFLGAEAVQKESEPVSAAADPDNPLTLRIDPSAQDKERTIDQVTLTNQIVNLALECYPDDELLKLLAVNWEKQLILIQGFYQAKRNRNWNRYDYDEWAMAVRLSVEKPFGDRLVSNEEIEELKKKFAKVREEVLANESALPRFQPKFNFFVYTRDGNGHSRGEIKEVNGKKTRIGNFAAIEVNETIQFQKIPFTLGLEPGWHTLAAISDTGLELRHLRLKVRINDRGFYELERLPMQTHEDAQERIRFLTERRAQRELEMEQNAVADAHPEIFDLERERKIIDTEHTNFSIAFCEDDLPAEINTQDELINYLKSLTPEAIGKLRILLVRNRGDDGEREWFGHKKKSKGKPMGWGFPGGGVEPDPWSGIWKELLEKMVPSDLWNQVRDNPYLFRLLSHLVREFVQETFGFEPTRIFGRIARIQKGENHVDHFWLTKTKLEPTDSRTKKEIHEIDKVQWFTIDEIFAMKIGGLDVKNPKQRLDCPYCSHVKVFVESLFEKHSIPMPQGMRDFLGRLRKNH